MKNKFLLFAMFLISAVGLYIPVSYSQSPCPGIDTVVYTGKTYNTVAIGDQCWLKENLDVGTMIDSLQDQTNNAIIEKYCYRNNPANCNTCGGLYQWKEAMQYVTTEGTQGICPTGWHIPSLAEFQTLATTVSNNGNALKEGGSNTSGFSALVAGIRYWYGVFEGLGDSQSDAYFWSSTEIGGIYGSFMYLPALNSSIMFSTGGIKEDGFSIRCLNGLSTVPVELGLFTAVADGRAIHLNWTTQTEKNSDKFVIERKSIGQEWETVGSVKAAVLSNSPKQYSYSDKNLQAGKYQYRLKMIDNDGTFKYSKVIETEVSVPKNYELSQNFPNPFNPNTVISYSLPIASNVKLIVFNSLGQTVKVLENGFKNAGTYSVNFNAAELPSGTYYYKIEAGQFTQIKKMILLK